MLLQLVLTMKTKKSVVVVIFLILLSAGLLGRFYFKDSSNGSAMKTEQATSNLGEKNYLLADYPVETVPLYKLKKVSASKFFVNDDPNNFASYFGQPVNYYNVVFETEANPTELLAYYRSLMSEVNETATSAETIEGQIGKYKVSASHYGNNPQNYAYLQVYLPVTEYQKTNRYFQDYPELVALDESLVEYESSFGLLNQKGGEVEYWQYFSLPAETEERANLIKSYQDKYQLQTNYSFDEKTGLMKWQDGDYSINLTFSTDHGRVYLMIRRPI